MALDYRKCAEEIAANIGGGKNVVSAAHCATRLRLVIADNAKVNKKALEDVEGVKGMFESNGQLQLIIGTGTVNKVYDEFLAVTGASAATKEDVKAAAAAKQPLPKRMVKALGDVFVPILPAIVASGLMMGLVEALAKIPGLGFGSSDWFAFLDMAANTAFAYLPVIVAVSAARVFGGNIFLGAVIGLMMIHAGLLNGWNVANAEQVAKFFGIAVNGVDPHLVTDWTGVTVESLGGIPQWNLFGSILPITRVGYQGHVIPVIISVFLMCQIEKWFHKHVPEMLDLFITPLCTVVLTGLLTFTIIGPIFSRLETMVLSFAEVLVHNPLGAMAMGAVYPITVVMGLHHMYNVIEAGMLSSTGLNTWMPIASAANFAQFGACLAVGLKAARQKTKVIAIPSSMSAALGITEPAIFGVNMRFFKPFVCGMIGGAVGAVFGAVTGIGASAYGVTGIPGYLTINNPLVYTILLAVSGGIAFAATWVIWKEDAEEAAPAAAPAAGAAAAKTAVDIMTAGAETAPFEQTPVVTCEAGSMLKPLSGKIVKLENVPDPTFASGMLGAGVGIQPDEERFATVYAPFDGTVVTVAETKHAVGLAADTGLEAFIHIGIDTVNMKGEGFEAFVKDGDTVKAGQKMVTFDRDKIREAGYPDVTMVLLGNSMIFTDVNTAEEG